MTTLEDLYRSHNSEHRSNIIRFFYDDSWVSAQFYPEYRVKIKDRHHSKAMQRKFKRKDIRIGDLIYTKLRWASKSISLASKDNPATGFAIERDKVVLMYSMPVKTNEFAIERVVLFEKTKKISNAVLSFDISDMAYQYNYLNFRTVVFNFNNITVEAEEF